MAEVTVRPMTTAPTGPHCETEADVGWRIVGIGITVGVWIRLGVCVGVRIRVYGHTERPANEDAYMGARRYSGPYDQHDGKYAKTKPS